MTERSKNLLKTINRILSDENTIDPFAVMEEILTDENISPEDRALFHEKHEIFLQIAGEFNKSPQLAEALGVVYAYGLTIGYYLYGRDLEITEVIDEALRHQRQSTAGKKSGEARKEKPWHTPVAKFAIKMRQKISTLQRTRLVEMILEQNFDEFGKEAPSEKTISRFLTQLEGAGVLPRVKPITRSKIS